MSPNISSQYNNVMRSRICERHYSGLFYSSYMNRTDKKVFPRREFSLYKGYFAKIKIFLKNFKKHIDN
ncbi:MAG TPA: hypothetical protein DCQ76_02610 [Ruminococcaceae bacterium]|nr:hypothetical protein [Oscillospiraceae bacterium]